MDTRSHSKTQKNGGRSAPSFILFGVLKIRQNTVQNTCQGCPDGMSRSIFALAKLPWERISVCALKGDGDTSCCSQCSRGWYVGKVHKHDVVTEAQILSIQVASGWMRALSLRNAECLRYSAPLFKAKQPVSSLLLFQDRRTTCTGCRRAGSSTHSELWARSKTGAGAASTSSSPACKVPPWPGGSSAPKSSSMPRHVPEATGPACAAEGTSRGYGWARRMRA